MDRDAILPFVRLNLVPGIGPILAGRLLDAFDNNAERILGATASQLRQVRGIGAAAASALRNPAHRETAREEVELAAEHGIRVMTPADDAWPAGLRTIADPPVLLYVRGELRADDAVAIAVVGTRKPNFYGRDQAHRFGDQLARAGFTVVSGFATGVDTAAHEGAVAAAGRTVAVLGSGLLDIYPPENVDFADDVAAHGAVVSEFPLRTAPSTGTFPRRNRLIAALSLGTLVVQADRRSGALITAQVAVEYGREVFAIPGPIDTDRHAGCHRLIQTGARLVTRIGDILDELGPVSDGLAADQAAHEARQRDLFGTAGSQPDDVPGVAPVPPLTPDEAAVHGVLDSEPQSVDQLAGAAGLPVHRAIGALTMLEMKQLARQLAGRHYIRR